MTAVWGAAAILERFFGSTHIVLQQNTGENGRIVIDKDRNEIFFHDGGIIMIPVK